MTNFLNIKLKHKKLEVKNNAQKIYKKTFL